MSAEGVHHTIETLQREVEALQSATTNPAQSQGVLLEALGAFRRMLEELHVAEVAPTDALFREPVRAFSGGSACWRVAIRDARNRPVAAARVQIDVVTPDGAVRGRTTAMSGSDGLALFVSAGRGRNRRRIHCAGGSRVARHPRRRHVRPCRRHGSFGQLFGEPPREAAGAVLTARG